ncbi:MAG: carbonic anhydrase family protein [Rubripirellula sp.]|nr:carbonic anhydrase family protein [Rubripirellula sp.]
MIIRSTFPFLAISLTASIVFVLSSQMASSQEIDAGLLPREKRVMTREEQQALTPQEILNLLKSGNARYAAGTLTQRNHSKQIRSAIKGQFPKAVVLSCVDSRVPVEDVFDCGIGDLFVARVAGNFANTDILGSMEFACKVSGSKVAVILGHDNCGAVRAAIDRVELGNITKMLTRIEPAVASLENYPGQKTSKDPKFLSKVIERNVLMTISYIRKNSPILKMMEENGDLILVGGIYDMDTGKVIFID